MLRQAQHERGLAPDAHLQTLFGVRVKTIRNPVFEFLRRHQTRQNCESCLSRYRSSLRLSKGECEGTGPRAVPTRSCFDKLSTNGVSRPVRLFGTSGFATPFPLVEVEHTILSQHTPRVAVRAEPVEAQPSRYRSR